MCKTTKKKSQLKVEHVMVHGCNLNTQEVEAGRSQILGLLGLSHYTATINVCWRCQLSGGMIVL